MPDVADAADVGLGADVERLEVLAADVGRAHDVRREREHDVGLALRCAS